MPIELKQKMRDLWRTYTPYRGDTENHWAMYYTALYLITQIYPMSRANAGSMVGAPRRILKRLRNI